VATAQYSEFGDDVQRHLSAHLCHTRSSTAHISKDAIRSEIETLICDSKLTFFVIAHSLRPLVCSDCGFESRCGMKVCRLWVLCFDR